MLITRPRSILAAAATALALCLPLQSCRGRPDLSQRLATEEQRRAAAERLARFWQVTATGLGGVAVLALVAGAALGSRARRDAHDDRQAR